ncbi:NAD(P)H dehydrogenase [Actinocatenispora thailandica]|uniref:NAD(P)H dehydrogenase n=1 Tax=Actinocatenispora thailandica TaxID=227318 RepID=A0A7R7DQ16_9ACTN|nr:NAD(P)H-dependent oxidoreductase [Actinocatenispora thailandica]BCJ35775.1 NAD(P)H dehydrogenase [Actinocatenispora thailandica]
MKILWVSAHPEPRSLTGALRADGLRTLAALGHLYRESDLYAMGFDPVVRRDDYPAEPPGARLDVAAASHRAYRGGTLPAEIRTEQDKLRWADTVVVQFPLWWYGLPAILKGWFDRVFVKGFGYGVTDRDTGRIRRYGDGTLAGRRALAVVTVGAHGPSLGPRGIHGDLTDTLFGLLHGTFHYTGMQVLPPLLLTGANRVSAQRYEAMRTELTDRLHTLADTPPLPYRSERGGDYDADLVLRADLAPGRTGPAVHSTDGDEEHRAPKTAAGTVPLP